MTNSATSLPATSVSRYLTVRGRRVHLRTWGDPEAPPLFLLHGAMDSSAPFQFVVDHLPVGRHCVAPDWCGGGRSDPAWCHWYPDFVADLDGIAEHLSPERPVDVVGHSRGGNVACLYAGVRPERVRRLMTVEGIGYSYASGDPDEGIATLAGWLGEQRNRRSPRPYETIEKLAGSLARNNPGLTAEQAAFIAREWNVPVEGGGLRLATAFFPREKEGVPVTLPQAMAYWKRITAPVCYVYGERSHFTRRTVEQPDDFARRKACFADWREVRIPDAGHMVQYDQPRLLAAAIAEFFGLGTSADRSASPRTRQA